MINKYILMERHNFWTQAHLVQAAYDQPNAMFVVLIARNVKHVRPNHIVVLT